MAFESYNEREMIGEIFAALLKPATGDGAVKRNAGLKDPWWVDKSHGSKMMSHLDRYLAGERRDPDSGTHPLIHVAWRALALAYQEMTNNEPPGSWLVGLRR